MRKGPAASVYFVSYHSFYHVDLKVVLFLALLNRIAPLCSKKVVGLLGFCNILAACWSIVGL